eukprot:3496242-Alexandrium_andersonii.AAC.1
MQRCKVRLAHTRRSRRLLRSPGRREGHMRTRHVMSLAKVAPSPPQVSVLTLSALSLAAAAGAGARPTGAGRRRASKRVTSCPPAGKRQT